MKTNGLITTVGASTRTTAARDAVYATIADLSTHIIWGGDGTGDTNGEAMEPATRSSGC